MHMRVRAATAAVIATAGLLFGAGATATMTVVRVDKCPLCCPAGALLKFEVNGTVSEAAVIAPEHWRCVETRRRLGKNDNIPNSQDNAGGEKITDKSTNAEANAKDSAVKISSNQGNAGGKTILEKDTTSTNTISNSQANATNFSPPKNEGKETRESPSEKSNGNNEEKELQEEEEDKTSFGNSNGNSGANKDETSSGNGNGNSGANKDETSSSNGNSNSGANKDETSSSNGNGNSGANKDETSSGNGNGNSGANKDETSSGNGNGNSGANKDETSSGNGNGNSGANKDKTSSGNGNGNSGANKDKTSSGNGNGNSGANKDKTSSGNGNGNSGVGINSHYADAPVTPPAVSGDPCFEEAGGSFGQCKKLVQRGICEWDAQNSRCIDTQLQSEPPEPQVGPMDSCRAIGLDCNERLGGVCYTQPSNGWFPAYPVCLFRLPPNNVSTSSTSSTSATTAAIEIVTNFNCQGKAKKCEHSKQSGEPDEPGKSPGYCPPTESPHSNEQSSSSCSSNARPPDGAPASCATNVCAFEKSIYGTKEEESVFCKSVRKGRLSHRQMNLFCQRNATTAESAWGTGKASETCSQCERFCESLQEVRDVANTYEDSCQVAALLGSSKCPKGMAHAQGRCFWIEKSFSTRKQSRERNVCGKTALSVYGVDAAAGRTAILNTQPLQCVSVALFRDIRGSSRGKGRGAWCGVEPVPFSYSVTRSWIGLSVNAEAPRARNEMVWEDTSAKAEWSNFAFTSDMVSTNSGGSNSSTTSTNIVGKGSAADDSDNLLYDVFAAAGVESGIWYASDPLSNMRAYTMCEFPADSGWKEPITEGVAEIVTVGEDECSDYRILNARVKVQQGLSASIRSNISAALRTVLVAELGIPGQFVQSLPTHCASSKSEKDLLGDGEGDEDGPALGRTLRKSTTRKLPSDPASEEASEVMGVAYAVPSDVTQEDIDGVDLEEVSAATTEQVYVLTNDASITDQSPSVESVTVVPSGEDGNIDEPDETAWWVVWVSIGGVVALSVLAIAMVLGAKRKRPQLSINTDTGIQLKPAKVTSNTSAGVEARKTQVWPVNSSRHGVDKAGRAGATSNGTSANVWSTFDDGFEFNEAQMDIFLDTLASPAHRGMVATAGAGAVVADAAAGTAAFTGYDDTHIVKKAHSWELDDDAHKVRKGNSWELASDDNGLNNSNLPRRMNSWELDFHNLKDAQAAASAASEASAVSAASAAKAASAASAAANSAATAARAAVYAAAAARAAAIVAKDSAGKRDRDTALKSRQKAKTWTDQEDRHILESVKANGTKGWAKVGKPIGRTAAQCAQRWHKVLNPSISKFVKWSKEEDAKLVQIHATHPEWTNKEIAECMPGRTATQCDNRWRDKANPALRWGQWSLIEDESMLEGRSLGLSWTNIVKNYPCLTNRAAVSVKNRWHSLQRTKHKRVAKSDQPG